MKYILKCYCCKEVKRVTHSFKNRDELEQAVLFCLDCMYQFDLKQNARSVVISIIVDEESTYIWFVNLLKNVYKERNYRIGYVKK